MPTPDDAIAEMGQDPGPLPVSHGEWPRYFAGSASKVVHQVGAMAETLQVGEVMVVTICHDHEARCHSYELLAAETELRSRRHR